MNDSLYEDEVESHAVNNDATSSLYEDEVIASSNDSLYEDEVYKISPYEQSIESARKRRGELTSQMKNWGMSNRIESDANAKELDAIDKKLAWADTEKADDLTKTVSWGNGVSMKDGETYEDGNGEYYRFDYEKAKRGEDPRIPVSSGEYDKTHYDYAKDYEDDGMSRSEMTNTDILKVEKHRNEKRAKAKQDAKDALAHYADRFGKAKGKVTFGAEELAADEIEANDADAQSAKKSLDDHGRNISHDRPMHFDRDDNGKITDYGTTRSMVMEEFDGTYSVIPTIRGEQGHTIEMTPEEAVAWYGLTRERDKKHEPGKKEGERWGNYATLEDAERASKDVSALHRKMYQNKWNQYIREHWDEMADSVKNAPGVKEDYESWVKAGSPRVEVDLEELRKNRETGEAEKPKAARTILEDVQANYQAETGEDVSKAYAAIHNIIPFLKTSDKVDAASEQARMEKQLDESYRNGDWAKNMEARYELEEHARIKDKARQFLDKTYLPWYKKPVAGGIENTGYTLEYVLAAGVGSALGAAGMVGAKAMDVAMPAATAAYNRFGELTANDYGVDENGDLVMSVEGDEKSAAATKAIVGGIAEAVIEKYLFDNPATKALGKTAVARQIRGKFMESVSKSKIGNAWLKTVEGFNKLGKFTAQQGTEVLEEDAQAIVDDVLGMGRRADEEYNGSSTLTWKGQLDILLNMLGTMGAQGAVGYAMTSMGERARNKAHRAQAKTIYDIPGLDKQLVDNMSDYEKAKFVGFYNKYSGNAEKLNEVADRLFGVNGKIELALRNAAQRNNVEMDRALEERGVTPENFVIPTDENGNVAFTPKQITDPIKGTRGVYPVAEDNAHGVSIVDVGSGRKFVVMDQYRGEYYGFNDLDSAKTFADGIVKLNQKKDLDNRVKVEYATELAQKNRVNVDVVESLTQLKQMVGDRGAQQMYASGVTGFVANGKIMLILDNCKTPAVMDNAVSQGAQRAQKQESGEANHAENAFIELLEAPESPVREVTTGPAAPETDENADFGDEEAALDAAQGENVATTIENAPKTPVEASEGVGQENVPTEAEPQQKAVVEANGESVEDSPIVQEETKSEPVVSKTETITDDVLTSVEKPSKTDTKQAETASAVSKSDSEPSKTDSEPSKTDSEPSKTDSEPSKTDSGIPTVESQRSVKTPVPKFKMNGAEGLLKQYKEVLTSETYTANVPSMRVAVASIRKHAQKKGSMYSKDWKNSVERIVKDAESRVAEMVEEIAKQRTKRIVESQQLRRGEMTDSEQSEMWKWAKRNIPSFEDTYWINAFVRGGKYVGMTTPPDVTFHKDLITDKVSARWKSDQLERFPADELISVSLNKHGEPTYSAKHDDRAKFIARFLFGMSPKEAVEYIKGIKTGVNKPGGVFDTMFSETINAEIGLIAEDNEHYGMADEYSYNNIDSVPDKILEEYNKVVSAWGKYKNGEKSEEQLAMEETQENEAEQDADEQAVVQQLIEDKALYDAARWSEDGNNVIMSDGTALTVKKLENGDLEVTDKDNGETFVVYSDEPNYEELFNEEDRPADTGTATLGGEEDVPGARGGNREETAGAEPVSGRGKRAGSPKRNASAYRGIVNKNATPEEIAARDEVLKNGGAVTLLDPEWFAQDDSVDNIVIPKLKIESDADAAALIQDYLYDPGKEKAKALYIYEGSDGDIGVIKVVGIGNVGMTTSGIDEVVAGVLPGCKKVIYSHNHISGDVTRSDADVKVTEDLRNAMFRAHPEVSVDHIITDTDRFYSFNSGNVTLAEIVPDNGARAVPYKDRTVASKGEIERICNSLSSVQNENATWLIGMGAHDEIMGMVALPVDGDFKRALAAIPGARRFAVAIGKTPFDRRAFLDELDTVGKDQHGRPLRKITYIVENGEATEFYAHEQDAARAAFLNEKKEAPVVPNETPAQQANREYFDKLGEIDGVHFTRAGEMVWLHGYDRKKIVKDELKKHGFKWGAFKGRDGQWHGIQAFGIAYGDIPQNSRLLEKIDETEGATQAALDADSKAYAERKGKTVEQRKAEKQAEAESVAKQRREGYKQTQEQVESDNSALDDIDLDNLAEDETEVSPTWEGGIGGIYTGSAADYEKPSLHKVGTGEGSQVYGWGLYGSTVRGVAEGYAVQEMGKRRWQKEYNIQRKIESVSRSMSYIEGQIEREPNNDSLRNQYAEKERRIKELQDELDALPKQNVYSQTFFTNRADGDESHLLNWYESVSDENIDRIKSQLVKEGWVDSKSVKTIYGGEYTPFHKGENERDYENKIDIFKNEKAEELYHDLSNLLGSSKAASEFLARADIDGIKYPVDSYGKTVKDGDKAGWNYVSFRDDNIRVDHKWRDGEQLFEGESEIPRPTTAMDKVFAVGVRRASNFLANGIGTKFADFVRYADETFGDKAAKLRKFYSTWYLEAGIDMGENVRDQMDDSIAVDRMAREMFGLAPRGKDKPGQRVAYVVQEHLLPSVEQKVNAESYNQGLDADQQLGVNLALNAVAKSDGNFMLADGTGFGKTRQILAIADQYKKSNPGARVLILTKSQNIIADSFAKDSASMGIDMGQFTVGTYDGLRAGKFTPVKDGLGIENDWDLVLLDEAHKLANSASATAQEYANLPVKHTVFATATPMDRTTDAAYFMAKLNNSDPQTIARSLGYQLVTLNNNGNEYVVAQPVNGMDEESIRRAIIMERDKAIASGKMIRRAYPFLGDIDTGRKVGMTDAHRKNEAEIVRFYTDEINKLRLAKKIWMDGERGRRGTYYFKGGVPRGQFGVAVNPNEWDGIVSKRKHQLLNRQVQAYDALNESMKASEAAKMAKDILAKEPGARIIICGTQKGEHHITGGFAESDKAMKLEGLRKDTKGKATVYAVEPSLSVADKALREAGITDIAHIYTGYDKAAEQQDFVSGRKNVLLMTDKSGGTGINLDDTTGEHPTYLLVLSPNYSAKEIDQLMGRVSRKNTKSLAHVMFLTNDSISDTHRANVTQKKLGVLKAIQGGADADALLPMGNESDADTDGTMLAEGEDEAPSRSQMTENDITKAILDSTLLDPMAKQYSGYTDKALVEKALEDDVLAFNALYRKYMKPDGLPGIIFRVANKYGATVNDAMIDAITSDVWSHPTRGVIAELRTKPETYRTYAFSTILFSKAGNFYKDYIGAMRRQGALTLDRPSLSRKNESNIDQILKNESNIDQKVADSYDSATEFVGGSVASETIGDTIGVMRRQSARDRIQDIIMQLTEDDARMFKEIYAYELSRGDRPKGSSDKITDEEGRKIAAKVKKPYGVFVSEWRSLMKKIRTNEIDTLGYLAGDVEGSRYSPVELIDMMREQDLNDMADVVELREKGMNYAQIAKELDMEENAVRTQISRAHRDFDYRPSMSMAPSGMAVQDEFYLDDNEVFVERKKPTAKKKVASQYAQDMLFEGESEVGMGMDNAFRDDFFKSHKIEAFAKRKGRTVEDLQKKLNREISNYENARRQIDDMAASGKFAPTDDQQVLIGWFLKEARDEFDADWKGQMEAEANGDEALAKDWAQKMDNVRPWLMKLERLNDRLGSEWGRAGRARQLRIMQDYSLANQIVQAEKQAGRALTKEEIDQLRPLCERLRESGIELDAAKMEQLDFMVKSLVDSWINGEKRRVDVDRKLGKGDKKIEMEYETALRQMAFYKDRVITVIPDVKKWLNAIVRHHLLVGDIYQADGKVDEPKAVESVIRDVGGQGVMATDWQVRQILTDMGKSTVPPQNKLERDRRELNTQMLIEQQIAYMLKYGEMPPVTGYMRDIQSMAVRELRKRRDAVIKEMGLNADKEEGRLKSALDRAKRNVMNRIEEIRAAIANGERIPKEKRTPNQDAELLALKADLKHEKELYDAAFTKTEEELFEATVRRTLGALKASGKYWEKRLENAKNGIFDKEDKTPVSTPEIEAMRKANEAMKDEFEALKEAAWPEGTPKEIEQKCSAREKHLLSQIEKKDEQIRAYENASTFEERRKALEKDTRKDKLMTPKIAALEAEDANRRQKIEEFKRKLAEEDSTTADKILRNADDFLSVPRIMRTVLDASATFTQAGAYSLGSPIEAAKALGKSMMAVSEKHGDVINQMLRNDLYFDDFTKMGGHVYGNVEGRPEVFRGMNRFVGRIPFIRDIAGASERAFATYLNVFAISQYKALVNSPAFGPGGPTEAQRRRLAAFVNTALGYGYGSKGKSANALADVALWAPRLMAASVKTAFAYDTWGQAFGGRRSEYGAKERFQTARVIGAKWAKAMAAGAALQVLMNLLWADDDEDKWDTFKDLTSGDFMTAKQGRIHFTGAMGRYTRWWQLLAMAITGDKNGKRFDLDSAAWRKLSGAFNPSLALVLDLVRRRDFVGNEIDWGKFSPKGKDEKVVGALPHIFESTVVPLFVADMYDSLMQNGLGKTAAMAIPMFLGMGVKTYDNDKLKAVDESAKRYLNGMKEKKMEAEEMDDQELADKIEKEADSKMDKNTPRGKAYEKAVGVLKMERQLESINKQLRGLTPSAKSYEKLTKARDELKEKLKKKNPETGNTLREEAEESARKLKWHSPTSWEG